MAEVPTAQDLEERQVNDLLEKINDIVAPPPSSSTVSGTRTGTPAATVVNAVKPRTEMPEITRVPTVQEIEERQLGDLINKGKDKITDKAKDLSSVAGQGVSKVSSAAGAAKTAVNEKLNEAAEKLSQKLGIKDFYNLHVMDTCNGDFDKDKGGAANVSFYTVPLQTAQSNVSALLDKELGVGPLKFNLAKLGIVGELQDKLNVVPNMLRALAALYIMGAGFAAAGLIASAVGVICTVCCGVDIETTSPKKLLILTGANMGLFILSAIFLLSGSLVTTLSGANVVGVINKLGNPIGLFATMSVKFQAMSWGALAFVLIAALVWTLGFIKALKKHKEWKRGGEGGSPAYPAEQGVEGGGDMSPYQNDDAYSFDDRNKEMDYVSGDDLVHSDHHSAGGSSGGYTPPPPPVPVYGGGRY